jgi:diguanylate cyclase (GGDEF)-like protein
VKAIFIAGLGAALVASSTYAQLTQVVGQPVLRAPAPMAPEDLRSHPNFGQPATKLPRAVLIDPLTGVANRRGFFETGERLLKRARFARQPAALVMFDLDRFKSINDRYGHHIGDEVLTAFSRLVSSQLRPNDLFGRIGGEEFASLLPETGHHDATRLAERVRSAVEISSHAVGHDTIDLTVSVGVATAGKECSDLTALMDSADKALYRAKTLGRNRVEPPPHGVEQRSTQPQLLAI